MIKGYETAESVKHDTSKVRIESRGTSVVDKMLSPSAARGQP